MSRKEAFKKWFQHKTIQHLKMRDVAFWVKDVVDETDTTLSVAGIWINVIAQPQYAIGPETITIQKTDLEAWRTI